MDKPSDSVIITPSAADVALINGYKSENKWRGYVLHECLKCQYNSIYLSKIRKHVEIGNHPWPFPSKVKDDPDLVKATDDGPVY